MIDGILSYIRSWFPVSHFGEESRKRRAVESLSFGKAKQRRVLSPLSNNIEDVTLSGTWLRSSPKSPLETIVLDEDNHRQRPIEQRWSKNRRSLENHYKLNGNSDDITFVKTIKSTEEKKLENKRLGFSYITQFTSDLKPIKTKLDMDLEAKRKESTPNVKPQRTLNRSFASSPSLNYSIRLDDKRRYQELLDSFSNGSINVSMYGTPNSSLSGPNRSRLVEMARSPKSPEVVDLTGGNKRLLSTKDRVIKILDQFDDEPAVIDDSDSDVEILPTPPSPKPDIKVEPVNSLKTFIDTSKTANRDWLDDVTKKHERFVNKKSKEIESYADSSTALNVINRDLLIKSLTKRVRESLAIRDTILPVEEEEEEVELPPLTEEHIRIVKKAFSGDPNQVLTKKFNLNVTRRDILTLSGLNWLNDNVINFYMNLIIERGSDSDKWPKSYAMNTFFYQKLTTSGPESLRRWTRRIDLFSYEFVCVPIHLGMHWCMAIINLKEKTIKYYDSMGKANNQCLNSLKHYLEYEHMDKKGQSYSTKDFCLENVQGIPQQMNGSDCGMFSCTFAEFATRKAKFTFQQENMPYLRKKMVVEIIQGELLIQ